MMVCRNQGAMRQQMKPYKVECLFSGEPLSILFPSNSTARPHPLTWMG